MPDKEDELRARGERMFKLREQRKADDVTAVAEYHAALQKTRDGTQELRRSGLARTALKHLTIATIITVNAVIISTETGAASGLLCPWNFDWRHTAAWQQGARKPTPYFAPPGCFTDRWVTTPHSVTWKRLYVCR